MFVQIFLSVSDFVLVNVNHLVSLQPNGGGTSIILSDGTKFHSVETYDQIIERIKL